MLLIPRPAVLLKAFPRLSSPDWLIPEAEMTGDLRTLYQYALCLHLGAGLVTLLVTRKYPKWARLGIAVLPSLALIVAWNWWISLAVRSVSTHWSGPRLAPALALVHGYKLYQPPDRGPVSGWIYPPVSALSYLPATIFGDPTAMILSGRLMSLLFYFGPVCWLLIREARGQRISPVVAGLLFASFAFLTNDSLPLRYVSTEIIADAPTLALGAVAMSLVGLMHGASPSRRAAMATGACTLAAWSKQLAFPLLFIPLLWAGCTGGWRALGRCLQISVAVVGGISLPIVLAFGPRELFFNTVVVPGRHPWFEVTWSGICRVVFERMDDARWLTAFLAVGLASVGAFVCIRVKNGRAVDLFPLTWLPFALAGLFEIPFSMLGMVKVGGAVNSLSHVLYYWTVAAMLFSGRLSAQAPRVCWLILGVAVTLGIFDERRTSSLMSELSSPSNGEMSREMSWIQEQQMVLRYLRAHPGEAYFPNCPLEHLAVEGRLPHCEDGILSRALARLPLSTDHLWRHIPPGVRRICYPAGRTYTDFYTAHSLVKFRRQVVVDELPGCVCFERSVAASPRPKNPSSPSPTTTPVLH
jgi:hypothetical protein